MKNISLLFIFTLFVFAVSAQAQQRFAANLSAAQVVPPSSSPGRGVCLLTLDPTETQIFIECEYEDLSSPAATAVMGFGAPVGGNGSSAFFTTIDGGGQSGTVSFTVPLDAQRLAYLRSNQTYVYINNQNATEIRGQIHIANGAYNDFDGDGRTDLTVYRNSNNTFYAQSSLTGAFLEQPLGRPGDSVSLTVDFDGDARSDFSTAGYNGQFVWRIFESSTQTLREIEWGNSDLGDFFAAADYDGDGRFDIAVFRQGVWHIIESSTGAYRYEYFGQTGDIPAANDFDKDGRADLTVARSESGQRVWYIRHSSDGRFYSIPWGLSSDAFFTGRADWDGDGAHDISVIRSESGQRVFYILRSSDRQLQVIRWGLSSDVVKLGDYDGDGRTDAAVTRALGGQRVFFILESSTGEPRYEVFGLPGDF